MSASEAVKRKEPEPSSEGAAEAAPAEAAKAAPAEEAGKSAAAAPAKPAAEEPDAKRARPTPPDPAAVRKQIEYYMSDENLRYDKFFSEKIASDGEGWLDLNLVLSCNKMKALRATREDIVVALKDSKVELKADSSAVRRPGNAALPKLEAKPQHVKRTSVHAHDGGAIVVFKDIPAEQNWQQVKENLKAKLPAKVSLWFVSEVSDKSTCTVVTAPFEGDLKFFESLTLEVGGASLKAELATGDVLQASLKLLPKHIREKREKESRKKQKERSKPIVVGTQKFVSVAALRGRVKEILNSRSDGESLKPDGTDFKLLKALLEYHPKGAEKSKGMVGIKVAKSQQGDSRCFHMVREDMTQEDFSAKKCLDAIEMNPPYVQSEPAKKAAPANAEASGAKAESKGEEPAAKAPEAEKKAEEPAAKAPEAEKKAEEPAAEAPEADKMAEDKPEAKEGEADKMAEDKPEAKEGEAEKTEETKA